MPGPFYSRNNLVFKWSASEAAHRVRDIPLVQLSYKGGKAREARRPGGTKDALASTCIGVKGVLLFSGCHLTERRGITAATSGAFVRGYLSEVHLGIYGYLVSFAGAANFDVRKAAIAGLE